MNEKKSVLSKLSTIFRVILPMVLITWLLNQVNWKQIWPLIRQVSWGTIVLSGFLFILAQSVSAIRWRYLLQLQEIIVPYRKLLELIFVGLFVSNFLPTTIGGDALRMFGVSQGQDKHTVALSSVLADRIYGLIGMVFLLPLVFTLREVSFLPGSAELENLRFASIVGFRLPGKIVVFLTQTWCDVQQWFNSIPKIVNSLSLSWLSTALSFGSFWVLTYALDIPVSYWQASAIALISYFVSLIPLTINGFGVQEGILLYLLMLQGSTFEQAFAAALLIRLVTMGTSLLGGFRLSMGWKGLLVQAAHTKQ